MQALFFNYYRRILLILILVTESAVAQVVINEYAPSNRKFLFDSDGDSPDWVELYNTGDTPVSLAGYALSDDTLETSKWKFPSVTIQAKGYLLVFCSGKDRNAGELHTNFSIGRGRESVLLFREGLLHDGMFAQCVPAYCSAGLFTDGGVQMVLFKTPTPGSSNNGSDTLSISPQQSTLSLSHTSGFYDNSFELNLNSDSEIRYTTDGTLPDDRSEIYTHPILIRNRSDEPNNFADKRTSTESRKPDGPVAKASVIRAVAWDQGCPVSEVVNASYFVGLDYSFPVVSIIADEDDLFDKDEGIYVRGRDDGREPNYMMKGSNWERYGWFEYFVNKSPVLQSGSGLRIHGRDSRHRPQKSLRVYAKEKYGDDSLRYPFFETKSITAYKRILVRTTWNHKTSTLFKDELAHYLLRDFNLGTQASQPVITFINGEYWGIHNLRERQDKYYISGNYGADPDNIDFLGIGLDGDEEIEGSWDDYNLLMDFIRNNDPAINENYDFINSQVDIENFIDYQIAYLYFSNYDWPRNNVRFWKEKKEGAKWKWMFFDCDVCFQRTEYDFLVNYFEGSEKYDPYSELIMWLFLLPTLFMAFRHPPGYR